LKTGEEYGIVPTENKDLKKAELVILRVATCLKKSETDPLVFHAKPSKWNCRFCSAKDVCPSRNRDF